MRFSLILVLAAFFAGMALTPGRADTGGYVKTSGYYFTDKSQDKGRVDLETNLELSFPFYNLGKGFASFKLYAHDLLGEKSQNELTLDEGYLDIYTRSVDARLGKQYIFWGRTSGVNTPTNNINPQDLTTLKPDPEEMRVAIEALKMTYYKGFDFSVQGVWIPGFTPTQLPSIPLPLGVKIGEKQLPEWKLENSSWGLKMDNYGRRGDFSLSYLYTWDDLPDFEYRTDQQGRLIPVYHRVGIYGADFSTGLGEFDIKGEAAYFSTQDEEGDSLFIKNPHLKYTFEVGYPLTDDVDIMGQLSGKKIFHFRAPQDYSGVSPEVAEQIAFFYGEQKEWQHSITTRLTYRTWYDTLTLELMGTYNLTLHDYLLSPELSYDIGEGFNLGLGSMIFEGEKNTEFGSMDKEDFIWCELSYSF